MSDEKYGADGLPVVVEKMTKAEEIQSRAQAALAELENPIFDEGIRPEDVHAVRLRLESIDFSTWGDELTPEMWAKMATAASIYNLRRYTGEQIASIMGTTRMSLHRWRTKDGGRLWRKAQQLLAETRLDHTVALARVALDETLVAGDIKDKLRAATFVLERTESDFLDPKYKLAPAGGDADGEFVDPMAGLSVAELRAFRELLSDDSIDLKALIAEAKKKKDAIDMG